MSIEKRPERGPRRGGRGRNGGMGRGGEDPGEFFGIDMDSLSPKAQAVTGLVVGGGILAGVGALLLLQPQFFWLIFIFGWFVFPAFGLFARGVAGLADAPKPEITPSSDKERELLEAMRDSGELTPAQAAMETSLSVKEADDMLKELAEGGHLQVQVRGGGLFYSMWSNETDHLEDGSENRES